MMYKGKLILGAFFEPLEEDAMIEFDGSPGQVELKELPRFKEEWQEVVMWMLLVKAHLNTETSSNTLIDFNAFMDKKRIFHAHVEHFSYVLKISKELMDFNQANEAPFDRIGFMSGEMNKVWDNLSALRTDNDHTRSLVEFMDGLKEDILESIRLIPALKKIVITTMDGDKIAKVAKGFNGLEVKFTDYTTNIIGSKLLPTQ